MADFNELLRRNKTFAAGDAGAGLTAMPTNRVFVVTCLDPRVEPAAFLGVGLGDAIVLRNPGGRVSDAVIEDVALISYMGEVMAAQGPPMEIAVIHHTHCGMGFLADWTFRQGFAERSGLGDDDLAARAVTDPQVTVRHDVGRLLSSNLATPRIVVSGHVLDLDTGQVSTVIPATAPKTAAPEPTRSATVDRQSA